MRIGNLEFKFLENGIMQVEQHWHAVERSVQHTYDLTKEQAESLLVFLEGHLGAKLFFEKPKAPEVAEPSEAPKAKKKSFLSKDDK